MENNEFSPAEVLPPPPARLLITDDHALVREGMRMMLEKEPDLVVAGEAQNGQEAVEMCRELLPDLVLMDVRMPLMDGLEATRAIKREFPTISILMVTTHESPEYLLDAIQAGAAGYVLKESARNRLLGAVRRVLDGESPLNQELALRLIRRLSGEEAARRPEQRLPPPVSNNHHPSLPPEPPEEPLSPRELNVLRAIALGRTNREVAEEMEVSRSTIKAHVQHIIAKLNVSDRTQAAVKAVELGLLPEK